MLNRVQLLGHLGKDPKVTTSASGGQIVTFSLATSESWRDKATGERKERTEWHNVVVFNEALGKVAQQYLKKGSKAFIEGTLRTRKWQDASGADRYSTEVVLAQFNGAIQLLDKADPDRAAGAPPPQENSYAAAKNAGGAAPAASAAAAADIDDDIPF